MRFGCSDKDQLRRQVKDGAVEGAIRKRHGLVISQCATATDRLVGHVDYWVIGRQRVARALSERHGSDALSQEATEGEMQRESEGETSRKVAGLQKKIEK